VEQYVIAQEELRLFEFLYAKVLELRSTATTELDGR